MTNPNLTPQQPQQSHLLDLAESQAQVPHVASASSPTKIPHEIYVLISAGFIIALGYGFISPILPQFATSFGVGMAAAGLVISVFGGVRLLFASVSGKLVELLGARWVYVTGLLTVAISTGLVGVSQQFWHMVLFRGIAGIGSVMFTVSAMGLIVKLSPPDIRGRCSSAYASSFLFGAILGPLAGAALAFLGMRLPFIIYGSLLLVAAAVVYVKLPKNIGALEPKHDQQTPVFLRELLKLPVYRAILFANFTNGFANFGVRIAVIPLFVYASFEHGGAKAGFVLSAQAVGTAIALQFSGRLSDAVGRKPLMIAGLGTAALFTAVTGFTTHFIVLLAISIIAGFGNGLFNPALQASLADILGGKRNEGRAVATFQMVADLGAIIGPICIGAVAQLYGFTMAFGITGAVIFFAAIQWIMVEDTLKKHLPEH